MKAYTTILLAVLLPLTSTKAQPVPVTVDNFIRAESDMYIGTNAKDPGLGKFKHNREMTPIANQPIIRMNRDTLYSGAAFDLDAGPVTITMPDAGERFMSLMIVNEDHYVQDVAYGAGAHTYTKEQIGTRYMMAAVRILANPVDKADLEEVHALQDAIKVSQAATGTWEVPDWDPQSHKKVREALLYLATTTTNTRNAAGRKGEVDPIGHLLITASGWGANPDKDAVYVFGAPPRNDGKTAYTLTVKDVPVDAFWSISVYNAEGFFEANEANAYSVNNLTAQKNADGSVTIHFGGADSQATNYLPITPGWNYAVRLYRPRAEILDGTWQFPEAVPVP